MQSSEKDPLHKRLLSGDDTAFRELYMKYYRLLFYRAFTLVEDEFIAKDIVQEAFVDFWSKKIYMKINSSLESYLFVMVHKRSLTALQRMKRQKIYNEQYVQDTAPVLRIEEQEAAGEHQHVVYNNLVIKVENQVSQLHRTQQAALKLFYTEKLNYKDAAARMGVTVNIFRNHLARGLRNLRNKFST